jgi:hypothetical protein
MDYSKFRKYCSWYCSKILQQIHDTVALSDLSYQILTGHMRGDQIHDTVTTIANSEDLIPFRLYPTDLNSSVSHWFAKIQSLCTISVPDFQSV